MKVRVKLRFRGRQKAHKEIGFQVVNQFIQDVAAYGRVDAPRHLAEFIELLAPVAEPTLSEQLIHLVHQLD